MSVKHIFKTLFFSSLITIILTYPIKKFSLLGENNLKKINLNYEIKLNPEKLMIKFDNDNFPRIYKFTIPIQGFKDIPINMDLSKSYQVMLKENIKYNFLNLIYYSKNDECPLKKSDAYKNLKYEIDGEFNKKITIVIKNQTEKILKQCQKSLDNIINETRLNAINIFKKDYINLINFFIKKPNTERNSIKKKKKKYESIKIIEQEDFNVVTSEIIKQEKTNLYNFFAILIFLILTALQILFHFLNLTKSQKRNYKKKLSVLFRP